MSIACDFSIYWTERITFKQLDLFNGREFDNHHHLNVMSIRNGIALNSNKVAIREIRGGEK